MWKASTALAPITLIHPPEEDREEEQQNLTLHSHNINLYTYFFSPNIAFFNAKKVKVSYFRKIESEVQMNNFR